MTRQHMLQILGIALTLRLAWTVFCLLSGEGYAGVMSEDSARFMNEARGIAAGEITWALFLPGAYDYAVMPIPQWALALSYLLSGGPIPYLVLQAAADALTCLLIARIAAEIRPEAARFAGFLAAVNPTQIALAAMVLTDTLFLTAATAALLTLVRICRSHDTPGPREAAKLGLLLGLAALCRTAIVPWIPVAAVLIVVTRRSLKSVAVGTFAVVLAVAMMTPVLYRNHAVYGEVAITPQGGDHLLGFVMPLVADFSGTMSRTEAEAEGQARLNARMAEMQPPLDTLQRGKVAQDVAGEMIAEMGPVALIKAWVTGAALNLAVPAVSVAPPTRALPHNSFYDTPGDGAVGKILAFLTDGDNTLYVLVVGGAALLTLPWLLALPVGMWRALRARPVPALIVILWAGYTLALNGPIASPKYRLPLESSWVVVAACALPRRLLEREN